MATCAEIRAQLASLLNDRDDLVSEILGDQGDVQELESEATHVNPTILAKAREKLAADKAKLKPLDDQIHALRGALAAHCFVMQPQQILEIQYANPSDVQDVDALYAQAIALGQSDPRDFLGGTFPSREAQQEWKQVLPADLTNTQAHNEDYEGANLVGATGWVLNPGFSDKDLPFTHPFGFDWEFSLALDQPPADPKRYTFLLTPADQSCDDDGYRKAVPQAEPFKDQQGHSIIPQGPDGLPSLLGVEIDGGLVPRQFSDSGRGGAALGDRIAVFGRWIVDCGHQRRIISCAGEDKHPGIEAFRTEIHPPLLMAAARVTTGSLLNPTTVHTPELTRVVFTSRPYLVSQRFTTDTDTIYDDAQSDDGPFVTHMAKEVLKANIPIPFIGSLQVEAHPKIKSYPFQGSYELHVIVRPPPLHGIVQLPHGPLTVSFQFTVRSGCSVQVTPSGSDAIDVVIRLNQDGYRPPPLPKRSERTWHKEELGELNEDGEVKYIEIELLSAAINLALPGLGTLGGILSAAEAHRILDQGILTDEYETSALLSVNILDASHAVSARPNNIPAGQGVVQNDDQPYPIYGWLEFGYAPAAAHP